MNNNENNDQKQISNEGLLRFLETGPQLVRRRDNRKPSKSGTTESDCPSAESYLHLASGAAEGGDADELLAHAATCPACGDVLARSLGAMDGNPSPEETAAIAEMAATRQEWQQRLARDLAATPSRKRNSNGHPSRWVGGSAIAAGLILAAGFYLWQKENNTPEHQLAMAYEQSRSLELRIPEAKYAGLTSGGRTRGGSANLEPSQLLDARSRLARELERSPQDPHWLELQARADVLEERYNAATDVLDRLIAQGPVNAELLADAASAYYQRGLVSGSELDRSTALDYLRRADELAPTDPVILFNEAIVMEDRGQMMNAVEVWNRYITVEHDPKWGAEGKRKLAALEQTLNRLKSHESRINQMLATPRAMDALAGDAQKLATLDEELSTYDLDKLLRTAYPLAEQSQRPSAASSQQARGSPCASSCLAARRLLKAISASLELQHHDFWLTDLLSPDIDTLPDATVATYSQALQSLAHAIREDETGVPAIGEEAARQSRMLFRHLGAVRGSIPSVTAAAHAGEERAAVEYMFALQRTVDFQGCRSFAQELRTRQQAERDIARYPWIEAQELVTEKVCDDTPETRTAGRELMGDASHLAETANYRLLVSRIQLVLAIDEQDAGDEETAEGLTLATLRELYAADPPLVRIVNTIAQLHVIEQDSSRAHMSEICLRETVEWHELLGSRAHAAEMRMDLARAEMRIGAMMETENQLRLAHEEGDASTLGKARGADFTEPEIFLAGSMLERGDSAGAEHELGLAAATLTNKSDSWATRAYASAKGQLQLAKGHFDEAATALESEIRQSEGKNVRGGDRATAAEFAQQDHDLYAELAATWLAQGRTPESVLALWERFRLRSRGLPITQCKGDALDCDQPRLEAARRTLGDGLVIGQVLLRDRVLIYHADRNGVTWTTIPRQRQDVLDAARTLQRAVSSPSTSTETAEKLGAGLTEALLPPLPAGMDSDALLMLEPDPLLQDLSWPVLPTPAGPLGLQYPLAEMRSILAAPAARELARSSSESRDRSLVVGASEVENGEPPLPEALTEARSVSQFLHSPELLLGDQATVAHVARAIDSATVFHFAGHALQAENGTELLLAASSPGEKRPWIDGAFLRQHPPRACRLAVLSACATGVREASWNHPLQEIVETLASLGVPEVVATRWQIDSEASVPFMDAFYNSLSEGKSVAVALTSARRVQFGKPLYKNPYYWAAYFVTGREGIHPTGELRARF